jgi:ABC-2 type transport system ATP-binding protein
MLPVALSLRKVRVRHGPAVAVDGVSLDVRRGEIVGLLGPNGAGKSSLLAAAAGVTTPCEGLVAIDGVERSLDPPGFAQRVGFVPAGDSLYDALSVATNLRFFGRLYGLDDIDLDARVGRGLVRAGLADRGHERVAGLSTGQKRRLTLVVALLHDPPVLLFDDPAAGLDAAGREGLFAELHRLRDDGHAILFATHLADEADHLCDRVALLDRGKLIAVGPPREVLRAKPGGRAVLYGHLREHLPKFVARGIRERLPGGAELEVVGRRVRLSAWTAADLGRALAAVLAEGISLDEFRTPAAGAAEPVRG